MNKISINYGKKLILIFFMIVVFALVSSACDMSTDLRMYEVEFAVEGEGEIEVKMNDDSKQISNEKHKFEENSIIKLKAKPDFGWQFERWELDDDFIPESEDGELKLEIMQDNQKVLAVFSELETGSVAGEFEIEHNFPFAVVDDFSSNYGGENRLETSKNESRRIYSGSGDRIKKQDNLKDSDEFIIGYKQKSSPEQVKDSLRDKGFLISKIRPELAIAVVEYNEKGAVMADKLSALTADDDIRYVEPNYRFYTQATASPNDKLYDRQWHYRQIRLPQAWRQTTGDRGVTVAVLDTGVNTGHPDLGEEVNEEAGYNVLDDSDDWADKNGHGTHVAGTIAADTNNKKGVAGVMWESSIVPVKVLGDDGGGTLDDIAAGIYYAAGLSEGDWEEDEFSSLPENPSPADIINLSLGGGSSSKLLHETVEKAVEAGVIIVAAAGNDGEEELMYPAAYEEVISVGAVDFNYPHEPELASYSNYSNKLDLLAPGGDKEFDSNDSGYKDGILSTGLEAGEYVYPNLEGTSMAAAHVSGVLGLMLSEGITPRTARKVINNTAIKLESTDYGSGLVNAYWAINEVDKIELSLQNEHGETVKAKAIPLKEKEFKLNNIPAGEYKLEALIDVRTTGGFEPGDYFAASEQIVVEKGEEVDISLQLEESL